MIGCASHRLNLAVNKYLQPFEPMLSKIHSIMLKLKSLKRSANLRKKTPLRPILRNKTRWSSTFEMLKRFKELDPFIPQTDAELMPYILTPNEKNSLIDLIQNLEQIQSVTLALQKSKGITLADVRYLFDSLIEKFPVLDSYHSKNGEIVAHKKLENGLVAIIDSKTNELTPEETSSVKDFRCKIMAYRTTTSTSNFAEELLQAKRLKTSGGDYQNINWLTPTSNVCERLFSISKLTQGYLRQNMTPMHLERSVFLFVNRSFWDVQTVEKIIYFFAFCHNGHYLFLMLRN